MCRILKIKKKKKKEKGTRTERQIKTSSRRNVPHTHTRSSDAPLWINTHSGVEEGNCVKLRAARKDKNVTIRSGSVASGGRAASLPPSPPPRCEKHKASSVCHPSVQTSPSQRSTVVSQAFDLCPLNGVQ